MEINTLAKADLESKNVLLRAGFDVPLENGQIADDRRIKATFPTMNEIFKKGASSLTIITHIGRPDGKVEPNLSVAPIREYIEKNYSQKVTVLENLRFDNREEGNDFEFARQIANGFEVYVQDAFSNLHRAHASMVQIPKILPTYAGLLVQNEILNLRKISENPQKPFVVIVGGAKAETKIPLIEKLKQMADWILIGGKTANEIIETKKYQGATNVILPVDGIKDENGQTRDIGKQTISIFKNKMKTAKTIFWNGNLGQTEKKEYLNGSKEIARFLCDLPNDAFVAVGGGDTAELMDKLILCKRIEFVSTGGGASLAFIAGEKLPGLEALNYK